MPHDDVFGFPATCRPALRTSGAIQFLDVDCAEDGGDEQPLTLKNMRQLCAARGQEYKHFVQVEWRPKNSGSQRYTYGATPEFARRLRGVIMRVCQHEAHSGNEPWAGESLGKMIHVARKKQDLIEDSLVFQDGLVREAAMAARESPSARYRAKKRAEAAAAAEPACKASQEETQTMTPPAERIICQENGGRGDRGDSSRCRLDFEEAGEVIYVD